MNSTKQIKYGFKLIFVLILGLMSLPINFLKIQAQSPLRRIEIIKFNQNDPPPDLGDRGAPGDRDGGGVRSPNCEKFESDLTGILPSIKQEKTFDNVWGSTIQTSPNLWFYIPYSAETVNQVELVIWDETNPNHRQHQLVYRGNFSLQKTPGIISLSWLEQVKLEDNKKYHWYLSISLKCNPKNKIGVDGWMWIDTQAKNALADILLGKSPQEQAYILAENGIWQDAFTLAAQNSETDWKKLLMDINLQNISSEKIVPCCTLVENKK